MFTFGISSENLAFAKTPGSLSPDFTLPDLDGKNVTLSKFRGKVVLLNFWNTWCGPCRAEMPSLNNLFLELKDKGLVVLSISIDTSEEPVRAFISERKLVFPVLMDKKQKVYAKKYFLYGLPVTILIDKKGIIVEKFIGERYWSSQEMKEKIIRLLDGQKI
ncbi:MAG: TlpA disulfide reductase family protein [Nitrospirae bacterium]|nr:TlpA disulfide reductase family protein [Nitrospirota bacterium]